MGKEGLSQKQASARLIEAGPNEIKRKERVSPYKVFFSQFSSPLILVLIGAAILSFVVGYVNGTHDLADTILILIIVVISGVAGFIQDFKAEKTIEALQGMAAPKASVIRDGKRVLIDFSQVVPGDVVLVEAGDVVPADIKILECFGVQVSEAVLTGESRAVEKRVNDSLFMFSSINAGSAKGVVINTGMNTKVGEIASGLEGITEGRSVFENDIANLSKKVLYAILVIVILVLFVGSFKYNFLDALLVAVSLAVAAIPEGLPALMVLTLAIGAGVMAKKNALIRKLSVTESIGAVDVICTDKTGTLTQGEMNVVEVFVDNKVFLANNIKSSSVERLALCGALCNNVKEVKKKFFGDETEVAIRNFSAKVGISPTIISKYHKIHEFSFTSKRKMMSVVVKNNKQTLFAKGAPEVLITKCSSILINGKIKPLDSKLRKIVLDQNTEFSSRALRVIGFAYKDNSNTEKDLVWIGLQAMSDPPRFGVKEALVQCESAGIMVMMLTGDSPVTASAIAKEIGLNSNGVITGDALAKLDDKSVEKVINNGVRIFARISPFHKLRILQILQKSYRVAMTGDGVNDALALKKANVGIAMGIKGTQVSKEASDIILVDDDFATIITAVREGRRVFDNIRKFLNYLFTCNLAEVLVIFLGTILFTLGGPILLPVQILWINLLTDGLPALALGADPSRPKVMAEKPRKRNSSIIDKELGSIIVAIGVQKALFLLGLFFVMLKFGVPHARTMLFTGFIIYEFVRIANIRADERLAWFSNKWLLLALGGSLVLQVIVIYSPLNKFFGIVPLGLYDWGVLAVFGIVGFVVARILTKIVRRVFSSSLA